MNNQKVSLVQKVITLDSAERTSGTGSSFNVGVDIPRFNAFNKVSVIMLEVPKGYYAQDADAPLTGFVDDTDAFTMLPFAGKFWDADTFAVDLKTALETASAKTFTVTYSAITGKLTITGSADFTFKTSNETLGKYMGIPYDNVEIASAASVLTSTNIVNMQRYDSLYVNCSIIANNGNPRLLTLFPSQTPDLAYIGYTAPDMDLGAVILSNNGTDNAHVTLVDKNNKAVNLNGLNMRLVLTMWNEEL